MHNVEMQDMRSVPDKGLYYQVCKSNQNTYELSKVLL